MSDPEDEGEFNDDGYGPTPVKEPTEYSIENAPFAIDWQDHELNNKRTHKESLPYEYFFRDDKKFIDNKKQEHQLEKQIDNTAIEAVVTTAGGLALMIPGAGPILFAGSVIATLGMQEAAIGAAGSKKSDAVVALEKELMSYIKEREVDKADAFISSVGSSVGISGEIGKFEKTDWGSYDGMSTLLTKIDRWCSNAGNDTFNQQIETLKSDWVWGNNRNMTLIIGLMNFNIQCMELVAILYANMSEACHKRSKDPELQEPNNSVAKIGWKEKAVTNFNNFINQIREISVYIASWVTIFNKWIVEKEIERRGKLGSLSRQDPSGGVLDAPKYWWSFTDDLPERKFSLGAWKHDISDRNCDLNDVSRKMVQYVGVMREYYEQQLDDHIDHHFDILKAAMDRWSKVGQLLKDQEKKWSSYEEAPNGVQMYRSMFGIPDPPSQQTQQTQQTEHAH